MQQVRKVNLFFTIVNFDARAAGECANHMSKKKVLYAHVTYNIFSTTGNIKATHFKKDTYNVRHSVIFLIQKSAARAFILLNFIFVGIYH
jgi:hypothetical protein